MTVKKLPFDTLVRELSYAADIPEPDVRYLFDLLCKRIVSLRYGHSIEIPLGSFTTKLVPPKVVKRINGVPLYGPVSYTFTLTAKPEAVFEIPDAGGITAGNFDPLAAWRMATLPKSLWKPTSPDLLPDPFQAPVYYDVDTGLPLPPEGSEDPDPDSTSED